MINLAANALYPEEELISGLGVTRTWLRRTVGAHSVEDGRRMYLGYDVQRAMVPVAPIVKPSQPPASASVVYFIQGEPGSPIKIGTTRDAVRRVRALQRCNGSVLRVLATIPGDATHEAEMHARFAHLRLHGEWFTAAPDLLAFIASGAKL